MLPYSGQIGYDQIRGEFGSPSDFSLKTAAQGGHGAFNNYSFIQPTNTGNTNHSPTNWYGYDGQWIVPEGLLVHWDAWPTVGSYPGVGTAVTNLADPQANGTLQNGTTWAAGTNGGSWQFDGADDYILSSTAVPGIITNQITVDFWVKWNNAINHGQGVGQGTYNNYGSPATATTWLMHGNGGGAQTVSFYVTDANGGSISGGTTSVLTTGNWYNIVGTMNSTNSVMYVNGVQTGTGAGVPAIGIVNNVNSTLFAGGDLRFDFRRMNGSIAAVKVYTQALTAAQVTQNFGALRGRFGI